MTQPVDDLAEIVDHFRPDYVVTPHIHVDAHQDHQYSTMAVREAIIKSGHTDVFVMFYANHLSNTNMHPFGLPDHLCLCPQSQGIQ
ncbi:PIG-L family deacetylase [Endozoicomonas numazuensis]|uniref:GlcNAc-PI de-N-acetylase n=1 Tax=Endozoicomonas numazuensis TaxID=1137799 RepID=A0A081NIM1_9GAMM|nr:PIG-L family deacetylase [Endozoicomonas numazuensis]KEQ18294.1 hypothetical protein GZ78_12295 [Endozoicomonas numazuensis]